MKFSPSSLALVEIVCATACVLGSIAIVLRTEPALPTLAILMVVLLGAQGILAATVAALQQRRLREATEQIGQYRGVLHTLLVELGPARVQAILTKSPTDQPKGDEHLVDNPQGAVEVPPPPC